MSNKVTADEIQKFRQLAEKLDDKPIPTTRVSQYAGDWALFVVMGARCVLPILRRLDAAEDVVRAARATAPLGIESWVNHLSATVDTYIEEVT